MFTRDQIWALSKPLIRRNLWLWNDGNYDDLTDMVLCVETVTENVASIIKGRKLTKQDLKIIIKSEVHKTLWLTDVDTWVSCFEWEERFKTNKKEVEKFMTSNWTQISTWKLDTYNLKRLAKFELKELWINSILDLINYTQEELDSLEFEYFESFQELLDYILKDKITSDYKENIAILFEILKFPSIYAEALKILHNNELVFTDDFKNIWFENFINQSLSDDYTWLDLISLVLDKSIDTISINDYDLFISRLNITDSDWVVFRAPISDSNSQIVYNSNKLSDKLKNIIWNKTKEEIKSDIHNILKENSLNNFFDIYLARKWSKILWKYWDYVSFNVMCSVFYWLNSSKSYTSINDIDKFSKDIWIDDLITSANKYINNETLKNIDTKSDILISTFYKNESWASLKWETIMKCVLKVSNSSWISEDMLPNFFKKLWVSDLSFKLKDSVFKSKRYLPEEFIWLSEKEVLSNIKDILIKNNIYTCLDLALLRKVKKFDWDFSPFDDFNHISLLLFWKGKISSINFTSIIWLWSKIWLKSIDSILSENIDSIKKLRVDDKKEVNLFWDTIMYESKTWITCSWVEFVKIYLNDVQLKKLSNFQINKTIKAYRAKIK